MMGDNKNIAISGIIIASVIGGILIFSAVPEDTWKDKRTDFAGVASPDERDAQIDCLSQGGEWDGTSCSNPESEAREFVYGEQEIQGVVDAFSAKYSEYGIEEFTDSQGQIWKYQAKTPGAHVELILGDERVMLRSYDKPDDSPLCMIINPFPSDVEDWCPPKW